MKASGSSRSSTPKVQRSGKGPGFLLNNFCALGPFGPFGPFLRVLLFPICFFLFNFISLFIVKKVHNIQNRKSSYNIKRNFLDLFLTFGPFGVSHA